jgi:hypothetical protein
LDVVGDDDCDCKQQRVGDGRGSGNGHDLGHFGDDHRFSHVNSYGCRVDFDFGHTGDTVGGSRPHPAIHRHGNLQRRDQAEPDQHSHLEFLGGDDCDCKQRRTGHEPGSGNGHDHSRLGNDHRFSHVNSYGCSVGFNSSDSQHGIGGSRVRAAIHRDGDVQRRYDAESDHHCDLGVVGGDDRDCKQRGVGDERGSGNGHDQGRIGDDPRVRHVDGHGAGVSFDCSDSQHGIGGSRVHAAIHRDGDV